MGDFNCAPDSAEYAALCGGIDPTYGPVATRGGLSDLWVAFGNGLDDGATVGKIDQPRRIDYVFAAGDIAERPGRIWVDRAAEGSDHLPVWCEIAL